MGRGRVTPYLGGMHRLSSLLLCLFLVACISAAAQDTFSIVAVDLATGRSAVGATCLDDNQIAEAVIISDVILDVGAIHTQSYWIPANQNAAHDQVVNNGLSPEELMAWLEDNDGENTPAVRQAGMADW